jgi:hypothetical protein
MTHAQYKRRYRAKLKRTQREQRRQAAEQRRAAREAAASHSKPQDANQ